VKVYSKQTFAKLRKERKLKICLDLVYKVEHEWEQTKKFPDDQILLLQSYLEVLSFERETLKVVSPNLLLASIKSKLSIRTLLSAASAFERELGISLKDDSIAVYSKDSVEPKGSKQPLYLILDNLRSAYNVGNVFRTADCFGIKHIYLVGYTATPEDVSVQKTAMGAEHHVSWSHVESLDSLLKKLKHEGVRVAALETAAASTAIQKALTKPNLALVLGNERFGLSQSCLEQVDYIFEIPMLGHKNSLNVSNACAVGVFEILRSWGSL